MTLPGVGNVGKAPDVVDIHRWRYLALLRTELTGRMLTELESGEVSPLLGVVDLSPSLIPL